MDAPCIASGSDEFRRNVGLAVIYPAFGAVGDRWPWWNPRIGAPSRYRALKRSYNASGLADPGCPVSPSLHHHPRNPVRSPLAQAAAATLSWYLSPRLSMAQAMRAVLLAMASSTTLVGRRTSRPVSQAERICFLRLDQLRWARAPCTNKRLM
jgi:hypothetical protein